MKTSTVIWSFKAFNRAVFLSAVVVTVVIAVPTYADTKLGYRISRANVPQPQNFNQGSTFANSTYKDVTVAPHLTRPPIAQQYYPDYPQRNNSYQNRLSQNHQNRSYPHQPYPAQNGLTIIYNQQFPSQTTYRHKGYGFVNGPANSTIESSSYMLISDWRRYHLPDPDIGMHWIYQNGRYLQIPNDR